MPTVSFLIYQTIINHKERKREIIPQYHYKCNSCNKETEITCKMSEYQSQIICECGSTAERKVEDMVADYVCKCLGFYGKSSK